jgi:hypothetical protein
MPRIPRAVAARPHPSSGNFQRVLGGVRCGGMGPGEAVKRGHVQRRGGWAGGEKTGEGESGVGRKKKEERGH